MRERPKHLEKAVADPRNEEPASPLRWETALKDQAERVAALRRALLAPWHACPGLPLPRGVHGPYQKRPCRKKWSGKALRSLILAKLLFGINALLKPSRAGSATGVHWSAAAFSRPLSRCFPLLYRPPVLRLWCANETSSAQWCICVPSLHLLILRREEARKGRWAGGDQVHPPALLLPGRHRASVAGKVPVPLRFLLSTLLMYMKKATDRFRRDSISCCNCAERFLLLHHTMYYCRPLF